MASKKYYWLKLKDDFFRNKEIKKLRKIAGGDTYTVIYLKLQLLSLKNEGKLFFENLEDTFVEEMALELDEDSENVKITFIYLQKHGLIEEVNENEFILPQTLKCIGSETQAAERVRKHRDNQKALRCNSGVTNCNTEKEIEIEKEIENIYTSDSIEYRLSEFLFNHIRKNNPKAKEPNLKKWAKIFDFILRIDKRELEEVKKVIEWCQENSFWYKNILSPEKLRKQYDALYMQMNDKYKEVKKEATSKVIPKEKPRKLLGWDD